MEQAHILVVDDDVIITKTMVMMLRKMNHETFSFNDPLQALKWLNSPNNKADLIISDVSMPKMNGYEFVSKVRESAATAEIPIIMLTAHGGIDNKVEGFKVGADDYLVKPVDRTELEWRIKALLNRAKKNTTPAETREAKVISVFSPRGGVGTSSLAVNLAVALAQSQDEEVILFDLALQSGHCDLMLNLNPKSSLIDIVAWDSPTVEPDIIERLLLKHSCGVKLLAAPSTPSEAELISVSVIDRIWTYLRATYPFIVIDAGSQFVEPAITILERSDSILLPMAPELGSVKAASDTLKIFDQLGFAEEITKLVLNHTFPYTTLDRKRIETALKTPLWAEIPNDPTAFVQAINYGRPHLLTNPNSQVSKAIAKIAHALSGDQSQAQESRKQKQNSSWVSKLVPA